MLCFGDPAGAQSALCRRLPLHLRRCVQEGGADLHGGQHPADAAVWHQHPHPVPLPQTLRQGVCQSVTLTVRAVCLSGCDGSVCALESPECSLCCLSAVCECGHGHADSGPVLLRDEPHGDGAGVGEGLAAGLRLPADGAGNQRPGRMGESSCLLSVYSL